MPEVAAAASEADVREGLKGTFVHLHNHTHYSLLDGLQKVGGMLDHVGEMGMDAVAMTDHGGLWGTVEFYNEAGKRGIKPIFGVETYVAPRRHTDKAGKIDANPFHLILLAENNTGYANLMKLVTIAQLDGYYYKPRIDRELLEQYHEGLIALSACAGGEIGGRIMDGLEEEAKQAALWYDRVFGRGNYFLELQAHEHQWPTQKKINDFKIALSKETGIPLVITADSHYSKHADREAHEVLLCVQTGKELTDPSRMKMDMDLYVSNPNEIIERWTHMPEVYENTVRIAERCNVTLDLGKILIPTFPVPVPNLGEREYLHRLCWAGMAFRYGGKTREEAEGMAEEEIRGIIDPKICERLDYELGVIAKMGYDGYFLIVADFINWGKDQGIIFGPGRGSAAGSIVAYVMKITDLDPIKYDLLFERFLNPDRISMPDIDIDIMAGRRGEVIEYVTEKYGEERVAQIITFGTMAARNSVRDTGRVLGMGYGEVDAIAKVVPQPVQGRHIPLAKSVVEDPDMKAAYHASPRNKQLVDLAMRLEGTIRSHGVHAAGVVIAPAPLVDYVPLQRAQKGGIATQYSMNHVEALGLLKMDFLGLLNLDVINDALRIIKKVYGVTIDLSSLPLDDPKPYELLSRGDTTGVFQLESAGMKKYLRALKPTVFDDIVAMVALYRPGPMQFIDSFIDRKHGREAIEYDHPGLASALDNTYGILVYQEQFMQISKEMCGFTGGQADTLRKAIGKKQRETMAKMKVAFIDGMVEHSGAKREFAEKFWGQLEAFADYCFNKSHSACYGLIAYQTAYLKSHYPSAFMAALLTNDFGNIDRIAIEIAECQRLGIKVLPPDVNQSFREFGVMKETGAIRFGLSAIKNVGSGAIDAILRAREEGGRFTSIEDFAKRVSARECNKKTWESLARCGAFDSLGVERSALLHNLDLIVSYAQKAQKNALSGQMDMFGLLGEGEVLPGLRLDPPTEQPNPREQLAWEKELIGLYLSNHPLDEFEGYLRDNAQPLGAVIPDHDGKMIRAGGMVTSVRKILTKKGANMAFVAIEDKAGTAVELIVFPKAYEANPELWQVDQIIIATGKISARDREGRLEDEAKVIVDAVKGVEYETVKNYKAKTPAAPEPVAIPAGPGARAAGPMVTRAAAPSAKAIPPETGPARMIDGLGLEIAIDSLSDQQLLHEIKKLIVAAPGETEVFLRLGGPEPKRLRLPFKVYASEALVGGLNGLLAKAAL